MIEGSLEHVCVNYAEMIFLMIKGFQSSLYLGLFRV